MRRSVEMGSHGQAEADQGQEGGDGVDDEDRGETVTCVGRQGEGVIVGIAAAREQAEIGRAHV